MYKIKKKLNFKNRKKKAILMKRAHTGLGVAITTFNEFYKKKLYNRGGKTVERQEKTDAQSEE